MSMYRLMLYYLIFLVVFASGLSFAEVLPYAVFDILGSAVYLSFVCWFTNKILAGIFKINSNPESSFITGLILSLIFGPVSLLSNPILLTAVGIFAMASKYLVTFRGRHIFNPAAFGTVTVALILDQGASWWIGNLPMLLPTLLGGLLILKKLKRYELVGIFLLTYLLFSFNNIPNLLLYSPILFFILVMLVEPLTTPLTKKYQILYGVIVAVFLLVITRYLPSVYYNLEISLLAGNVFSFIVSKKFRQVFKLRKKEQLSHNVTSFWFEPWKKFGFKPGQFMEWTLGHKNPDSRGVRRFFTIASSPTENLILLVSKFYEKPSTFKQALAKMEVGNEITASDLGGEFTLPSNLDAKLCFIAGGIGITPFRSMVKWMVDRKENRDMILLFSNKTKEDIVFDDIFKKAEQFGLKTVYINTDKDGYIDEKLIKGSVPDWKDRLFYISGPEPMVEVFEKLLSKMGLKKTQVKKDYFLGYTETYTIGQ